MHECAVLMYAPVGTVYIPATTINDIVTKRSPFACLPSYRPETPDNKACMIACVFNHV